MKTERSYHSGNVEEIKLDQLLSQNAARAIPRDAIKRISYSKRGLTLMELMLVVCIIGILSGIAVPAYLSYAAKVDAAQAVAEMTELALLIEKFYAENNRYPNSLVEIGKGGLKDPWGREYRYLNNWLIMASSATHKCTGCRKNGPVHPLNTDYDLFSIGKDGVSNDTIQSARSHDDIVRAFNGAYLGIVKEII